MLLEITGKLLQPSEPEQIGLTYSAYPKLSYLEHPMTMWNLVLLETLQSVGKFYIYYPAKTNSEPSRRPYYNVFRGFAKAAIISKIFDL